MESDGVVGRENVGFGGRKRVDFENSGEIEEERRSDCGSGIEGHVNTIFVITNHGH